MLYLFDQNEKTIVVENMEYLFTTNNEQTEFIKWDGNLIYSNIISIDHEIKYDKNEFLSYDTWIIWHPHFLTNHFILIIFTVVPK